jgi:hypothetical protein
MPELLRSAFVAASVGLGLGCVYAANTAFLTACGNAIE